MTLENEQVSTHAQLESIMNAADPRTRMSLMAFAGLRPQVIGSHDETNELRVLDAERLRVNDDGVSVISLAKMPARITIRH